MDKITLKTQQDFDLINKYGAKESSPCFLVIIYLDYSSKKFLDQDAFYYGLKVSKKFSKKAVVRNKAKRRIRALLHLLIKAGLLPAGAGLVFVPKKNFNDYPLKKIYQYLSKIASQLGSNKD